MGLAQHVLSQNTRVNTRSGVRPESKLQLPGARSVKTLSQKMPPCSEKSLMGRRERIWYFCLTQWHRGWWTGTFLPLETRCQGQRSGLAGVNIVNKIASHSRVISVTQNNKQLCFGRDAYQVRGVMTIFAPLWWNKATITLAILRQNTTLSSFRYCSETSELYILWEKLHWLSLSGHPVLVLATGDFKPSVIHRYRINKESFV